MKEEYESKILLWVISHTASNEAQEHVVEVDPKDSGWYTANLFQIASNEMFHPFSQYEIGGRHFS